VGILNKLVSLLIGNQANETLPDELVSETNVLPIEDELEYSFPERDALGNKLLRIYDTRVAGVSHTSELGKSRQKIIKTCNIGEIVILTPYPMDNYPKSVIIKRVNGDDIGFLPEDFIIKNDIFGRLQNGGTVLAKIKEFTGGTFNKPTIGCIIEIARYEMRKKVQNI
jgi:hypothetical protein